MGVSIRAVSMTLFVMGVSRQTKLD